MKNNTDKPIKWEKEFYKELDNVEATQDNNGIALFGYKVTRDGSEKFTIVDWGGVKQFISQAIQATREETEKKLWEYTIAQCDSFDPDTVGIHRCSAGHCGHCGICDTLSELLMAFPDSLTNKKNI